MNTIIKDVTIFKPFDIVSSLYYDIRGQKKVGLFLVVYTEHDDPNDYNNRNITGLKLTSKDVYANVYRTLVSISDCPKLKANSFVYANKPSTLLADECRFVDQLPPDLCEEVMSKLRQYTQSINEQTNSSLINKLKGGK